MSNITVISLLVALGIFVWLVARSKTLRSFQFQMSIFLEVWIFGEIAGNLQHSGIIVFTALQGDIGLKIYVVSMVFFSIMVWTTIIVAAAMIAECFFIVFVFLLSFNFFR
ncbi:MAG TPA: hypothetical protein VFI73_06540 [Candidatus Nitrosopolaris sp.]|nr:hypothetical protein [Candidatus Nitrosopolaris sp.]